MVYSSEIPSHSENEQSTTILKNMDASHKYNVEWKNPDTKNTPLWFHL